MNNTIPVIDVFAGCGGLGEGFSAIETNGTFPFDVRLSIEKEYAPIKTLQLRSFFHQFRGAERPESYYQYVRGEISRDEMFKGYPSEKKEAFLPLFTVRAWKSRSFPEYPEANIESNCRS